MRRRCHATGGGLESQPGKPVAKRTHEITATVIGSSHKLWCSSEQSANGSVNAYTEKKREVCRE